MQPAGSTSISYTQGFPAQLPPAHSRNGKRFLFPHAGKPLGRQPTVYEVERETRRLAGKSMYSPLKGEEEWKTAKWVNDSGISHGETDSLLKGPMVRSIMP